MLKTVQYFQLVCICNLFYRRLLNKIVLIMHFTQKGSVPSLPKLQRKSIQYILMYHPIPCDPSYQGAEILLDSGHASLWGQKDKLRLTHVLLIFYLFPLVGVRKARGTLKVGQELEVMASMTLWWYMVYFLKK